jgi:hypothetical protein
LPATAGFHPLGKLKPFAPLQLPNARRTEPELLRKLADQVERANKISIYILACEDI